MGFLFRNAGDVLVELGIELGEGLPELVEFGGGAMDLNPIQFGNSESFFDTRADVFKVLENSGSPDIGFATKDLVAADGEVVVEAGVFSGGLCDEFLHEGFEGVELAGLDFKIRVNADCLRELAHGGNCEE